METILKRMKEKKHALLSASSAHRWLNCLPSAVAESLVPETTSEFAEEGTLAHALAARDLYRYINVPPTDLRFTDTEEEIKRLSGRYHTDDMDRHVEAYVEYVKARYEEACETDPLTVLLIEHKVDFWQWVPDGFGTADAVIITNTTIEVIDLKYGMGVRVEAAENPQLRLYALGLYNLFIDLCSFEKVVTTIVQPRLGHVSQAECAVTDLLVWGNKTVSPLARVAYLGLGPRYAGGWCRFCRAKGTCATLANYSVRFIEDDCTTLSPEEIGELLPVADTAEIWIKAIRAEAHAKLQSGYPVKGYKLVRGMSKRIIIDSDRLATLLKESGVKRKAMYKPRALRTLTELERACGGRKKFETIAADTIGRTAPSPVLAPESDKRAAWNTGNEFKEILSDNK